MVKTAVRNGELHVDVETERAGVAEYLVCRPYGELDSNGAGTFRTCWQWIDPSRDLLIDLTGVSFMDSTGIGVLAACIRRSREGGGRVALCPGRPFLARVLKVTGIDRLVMLVERPGDVAGIFAPVD
ncbi:MAG: STAS domain-containing protein [Acidimicrobiales bacterium]